MDERKIDSITVPAYRMRTEFNDTYIAKLAQDIERNGLLHPPVVRDDLVQCMTLLAAGECRLRAIKTLFAAGKEFRHGKRIYTAAEGVLPVTNFGTLSELDALEIELSENVIRKDLSWQEHAKAAAKLDEVRRMRAEAEGRRHTTTDTAKEILGSQFDGGSNAQEIRDMITLAPFLGQDNVKGAKSLNEAKKILARDQRAILAEELGMRLGTKQSTHILEVNDSLTYIQGFADATFDIILTDPPYGIDMDKMKTQSGSSSGTAHAYEDTESYAEMCIASLALSGFRICKPDAHVYMFCDIELWPKWRKIFTERGWYVWPKPLIWSKSNAGSLLGTANGPRHCYEAILFAQKGAKLCKVASDVITTVAGNAELHPANKPPEILHELLSRSSMPGDMILDPFCGSGGIFPAATHFHCRAVGVERDEKYAAIARMNLHGE